MKHKDLAIGISTFLAASMTVGGLGVLSTVLSQKVYAYNFDDGIYDTWDGVTLDFSWYESPDISDNNISTYTISTAAQFASLQVITNDLSSPEYDGLFPDISAEYRELSEDFSNSVINVESDIDLTGIDWFPICYPWKTSNLSTGYSFVNTNGEQVNYNALKDVPDMTVDPFAEDGNVSTRYYEFPESEMRFRDLVKNDSTQILTEIGSYCDVMPDMDIRNPDRLAAIVNSGTAVGHNRENGGYLSILRVNPKFNVSTINKTDYTLNPVESYTYVDITGYTETNGFNGTINFNDHYIKGVTPKTKWTDDTDVRLYTYDPMCKGLFGLIGKTGQINNIRLQASYNDVVSYSGLLCGYNAGVISNCYVRGNLEEQLITQKYPIRRDYGPNGTSVYEFAENPGTVLPVGNNGFVCSVNSGRIESTLVEGEVTQTFRQFGSICCVNNGEIADTISKVDVESQPVTTDFITDEWSWEDGGHAVGMHGNIDYEYWAGVDNFLDNNNVTAGFYDRDITTQTEMSYYYYYGASVTDANTTPGTPVAGISVDWNKYLKDANSLAHTHLGGKIHFYGQGHSISGGGGWQIIGTSLFPNQLIRMTADFFNAPNTYIDISADPNETVIWNPATWALEDGDISIAANHLYGVYSINNVGGICVLNNGTISNSQNEGSITSLYNTSPRTAFSAYSDTDENKARREYTSYIRPTNQYSFLCTAVNTVNNASGVSIYNKGTITNNSFSTIVPEQRELTDIEKVKYDTSRVDFISYTDTGLYQNDCIVLGCNGEGNLYYPGGYRWWITEDSTESHVHQSVVEYTPRYGGPLGGSGATITYIYNYPEIDRNMPYPFMVKLDGDGSNYVTQLCSGICGYNFSEFSNSSFTINDINEKQYPVSVLGQNAVYSNIDYTLSDGETASYGLTQHAYNSEFDDLNLVDNTAWAVAIDSRDVIVNNVNLTNGSGLIQTAEHTDISNIYTDGNKASALVYKWDTGSLNSYICDRSIDYGVTSDGKNLNLDYVKIHAPEMGWGLGTIDLDETCSDITILANTSTHAIGELNNGKLSNVLVKIGADDSEQIASCAQVLSMKNVEALDVQIFTNIDAADASGIKADNCDIASLLWYGDIAASANNVDYLNTFTDCKGKDVTLQLNWDYIYKDLSEASGIQEIPGILKFATDSNEFETSAVQTPDGILSYNSYNIYQDDDSTIRTDCSLVYDENARTTGALAYYLDHGDKQDRTYDWTVAVNGKSFEVPDVFAASPLNIIVPAHTVRRDTINDISEPFYRADIPYTGIGAGEVKISSNGITTNAHEQLFPKTSVYGHLGDTISFETVLHGGELKSITKATTEKSELMNNQSTTGESYRVFSDTFETGDITYLCEWTSVRNITIDPESSNLVVINPSATGAVPGFTVYINPYSKDPNTVPSNLGYYLWDTNASNVQTIDYSTFTPIDSATMSFEMPDCDIALTSSSANSNAKIYKFTLGGIDLNIDQSTHTISGIFDNSIDLTNLTPEITLSADTSISPGADIPQDFTKPVVYTVTAPGGISVDYTVNIEAAEDGFITKFQVNGHMADIDQTAETIMLTVPTDADLTNVTPYIVWAGTSLSPEGSVDMSNGIDYTVTASDGTDKTYHVVVNRLDSIACLDSISFSKGETMVDDASHIIRVIAPYGTDFSEVELTEMTWHGKTSSCQVGDKFNLSKAQTVTFVNDLGQTVAYQVFGIETDFTAKYIFQFMLYGINADIDETNHTITLDIPSKYDISHIKPDVIGFTGKDITYAYDSKDYSHDITLTVTAFDGSTQDYTVHVNRV